MEKRDMNNILDFYYEVAQLKKKLRQGWIYWNVSGTRVESIAEHIYGSQMLAVAIYSQCKLNVDIFKVISMLALHETEEVRIGDFTPIDNVSDDEKLAMGNKAVNEIFQNLQENRTFIELITEFNERKTPEAKFAFLCDKFDCILQLKKYSDNEKCSIVNATLKVLSNSKVQDSIDKGANTVLDIFVEHDRFMYQGTVIEELFEYVRDYGIKE